LSSKAILDPKSALRLVETGETTSNNKVIALNNYNSDIIIINTSRSKSERGKTQDLAKYTRTT
jgi:hypothetical protein